MQNRISYPLPQPTPVKVAARIFSYIFHPLFIPVYVIAYLIFLHPYTFASLQHDRKVLKLISFFIITVFFPAFTVFLLWRLKFIESIMLRTQRERIIPYVASVIYFFWAWYVSKNQGGNPPILVFFLLGLFLAASAALTANNYFKISMHAMGAGGAVAFMILVGIHTFDPMGIPITVSTIVAGIICSSRLAVSDHEPMEIVWGFFVGALFQVIACWVVM